LPFLSKLAKDGYKKALNEDPNFLAGLNVYKGNVTYKAVADVFGYKYISPKEALAD
jgi:alanine dehydrogenase